MESPESIAAHATYVAALDIAASAVSLIPYSGSSERGLIDLAWQGVRLAGRYQQDEISLVHVETALENNMWGNAACAAIIKLIIQAKDR